VLHSLDAGLAPGGLIIALLVDARRELTRGPDADDQRWWCET
jgi:hypothetical protein